MNEDKSGARSRSIDDIVRHDETGTLPKLITETILGGRNDPEAVALREAAVAAHNAGTVDMLAPALALEAGRSEDYDFFAVQHFYVQVIPELEAEVEPMMAVVRALVAAAGNDGVAGRPNAAFRDWAAKGDRAEQTLGLIDTDRLDDAVFVMLALQALERMDAGAALDRMITYLAEPTKVAQLGAAAAIGSFDFTGESAFAPKALAALQTAIDVAVDDDLRGVIASAAVDIALCTHGANEAEVLNIIATAASFAGDETIHRLSQTLWLRGEDLSPAIVAALINILLKDRVESIGTLQNIDHAVGALTRKGRLNEALALLEPLLVAHIEFHDFEVLSGSAHALLQLEPDRLAHVIVKWLLSGKRPLGDAARGLISQVHGDPLTFRIDFAAKALSGEEAVFLARKTIGHLFLHPITVASILLSLIRAAPEAVAESIGEHLFDPLLLNFPGELSEWLTEQAKDEADAATPLVLTLLERLEGYLEGLRAIGHVRELQPSEREKLIENQRRLQSFQVAHKAAEDKSVFASLVSRSVLLYGNRSISYFERPSGQSERLEMKLGAVSHSVELPRLDTLEPFNLDYKLRVFRAERIAR